MTTGKDLLRGLNPAQRRAAEHVTGPILVLAGAGSGKTRVLTARIASLIESHGVPPERIFAVTFTNKAAGEMKHRIGDLLERDPTGLWIGTFHSLSARLLRREADRLGFSRDFSIYDQDDQLSLIRRLMDERNHPVKLYPPKLVQNLISGAKNAMQTAQELERSAPHDPAIQVAADVYVAMQRALKLANAMDFDDLILHPLTLFREHPDVLERWRRRFDFLLVDEFQDTNKVQYELIKLLGAGHRNVFVVGDDDQSIYGWRGADVRNMQSLQQDFGDAVLVKLEENYRSTKPILDAANAVIARNRGRLGKTLRTVRPGGESIVVLAAADERDEAEWIARELQRRVQDGALLRRVRHPLPDQRAVARAGRGAPARRRAVSHRRLDLVLRSPRGEGPAGLPAPDREPVRRRGVPSRGRRAAARHRRLLAGHARRAGAAVEPVDARHRRARRDDHRPAARTCARHSPTFAAQVNDVRTRVGESAPVLVMEELIRVLDYEKVLLAEGLEGADRWENVRAMVAGAAEWSEVISEERRARHAAAALPHRGGADVGRGHHRGP